MSLFKSDSLRVCDLKVTMSYELPGVNSAMHPLSQFSIHQSPLLQKNNHKDDASLMSKVTHGSVPARLAVLSCS